MGKTGNVDLPRKSISNILAASSPMRTENCFYYFLYFKQISFFLSPHASHHLIWTMDDHKQTFASSNLPIKKLDFSHNAIRRLADKTFSGIQVTIPEHRRIIKNNRKHVSIALIEDERTMNFLYSSPLIYCLSRIFHRIH